MTTNIRIYLYISILKLFVLRNTALRVYYLAVIRVRYPSTYTGYMNTMPSEVTGCPRRYIKLRVCRVCGLDATCAAFV